MDPVLAGTLLVALAREAPGLVAKVIAILHQQGKITTDEVVTFLSSFPTTGGVLFFPSLPAKVGPSPDPLVKP